MAEIRKIIEVLRNHRGEGYVDVIVIIMSAILVIALALKLFPAYITKQKLDTFAVEIMRVAEISGRVGTETTAEELRLQSNLGIVPTVTWSRTGSIQLRQHRTIIVI